MWPYLVPQRTYSQEAYEKMLIITNKEVSIKNNIAMCFPIRLPKNKKIADVYR